MNQQKKENCSVIITLMRINLKIEAVTGENPVVTGGMCSIILQVTFDSHRH